ncbi:MAG TPA: PIG-L family deacetylase, partial [Longimicrobiales bacterium]|nr:PIG-L family deacetylase [Longimicrobiales bacterium]
MLTRCLRAVVVPIALASTATTTAAQTRTEYRGANALGLALRPLGNTVRVLHIGAHPDDENTDLLATLALNRGVDVAYLSLTRGEGGQNGIGPELQEGLGLIRTEELLAARRLDGASQFFSRAYDFGFSKTAAETFSHWPRDSLLADVVAVIRKYRPDIVIAVFTGTPRDGHGQHQASGILAREAMQAAGDPNRFPEQIAAGLRPFTPAKFYQSPYGYRGRVDATLDAGQLDPLLGKSYHQIAMAARSRHRSQDMGVRQAPGRRPVNLVQIDPQTNQPVAHPSDSLFAGVPVSLAARAAALAKQAGGEARAVLQRAQAVLSDYDDGVAQVRRDILLMDPAEQVQALARLRNSLADVRRSVASLDDPAAVEMRFHLDDELNQIDDALLRAANVQVDVSAGDDQIVPGQPFEVSAIVWNGGPLPVTVHDFAPALPMGWSVQPKAVVAQNDGGFRGRNAIQATDTAAPPTVVQPGGLWRRTFTVTVAKNARPTEAYFLRKPRKGDLYQWPNDPALWGLPFQPQRVRAAGDLAIGAAEVPVDRAASYIDVDPHRGEVHVPVAVVPEVTVRLSPDLAILPLNQAGSRTLELSAQVTARAPDGTHGTLRLVAPDGWSVQPASVPVDLKHQDQERTARFSVRPPSSIQAGAHDLRAVFQDDGGQTYDVGFQRIDYPHIRPHRLYSKANTTVRAFDVRVAQGLNVGYIAGAGDDVPDALAQLGIQVHPLDADALAHGDLGQYDVIVTGIRAYEVRPDLDAHNQRLLDYVRRGGTLIVQYNKYPFASGGYAPYPVTMAHPHDRVTDENAAVKILQPDNPIFNVPNKIGPADWQGWVQERGLYFLHTWDSHFTPLLEMHDPGEAPLDGCTVETHLGKGTYVYTGLSLFRQLPAGVPGAYRL